MPVEFEAFAANVSSDPVCACSSAACFWLASTRAFSSSILGPSQPQFDVQPRMPSNDPRLNRRGERGRVFNRQ
jgi:hypothetical protein